MKSEAAKAAALIRKEIKGLYPDLKFTCTSKNYAGGCSIRVNYEDQPPNVHTVIKAMAGKYQYGHFDGMTDCYEYSNTQNTPQAKFVFVDNYLTPEKRQEVYENIRNTFAGGDKLPEKYQDAACIDFHGQWIDQLVWQEFSQA